MRRIQNPRVLGERVPRLIAKCRRDNNFGAYTRISDQRTFGPLVSFRPPQSPVRKSLGAKHFQVAVRTGWGVVPVRFDGGCVDSA